MCSLFSLTTASNYLHALVRYSETDIVNLLSFGKFADECYIIRDTRVDDVIQVQSKDDGKYLRFQRDHKFNLYYTDINEEDMDKHYQNIPVSFWWVLRCIITLSEYLMYVKTYDPSLRFDPQSYVCQ